MRVPIIYRLHDGMSRRKTIVNESVFPDDVIRSLAELFLEIALEQYKEIKEEDEDRPAEERADDLIA